MDISLLNEDVDRPPAQLLSLTLGDELATLEALDPAWMCVSLPAADKGKFVTHLSTSLDMSPLSAW
jgi:hypothetical protein